MYFGPIWVWSVPGCVENLCFAIGAPRRGFFFGQKLHFPKGWTWSFFNKEFSSKTRVLGHLVGEISRKSNSYGPYRPLQLSVTNQSWYLCSINFLCLFLILYPNFWVVFVFLVFFSFIQPTLAKKHCSWCTRWTPINIVTGPASSGGHFSRRWCQ